MDFSSVNEIYFAGGEPLLNSKHWEVLDNIENPENVSLHYNSNLATIKNVEKYIYYKPHLVILLQVMKPK